MELTKFKKKLNEEELDRIIQVARNTNIALQLISRGRVWIEINKESCRLQGDQKGLDLIMENKMIKKNLSTLFDYFGWNYERNENELSGEGVIAYTLFNILMGSIIDDKVTKEIFSNLKFSIK